MYIYIYINMYLYMYMRIYRFVFVTVSTVGYGDFSPRSILGQISGVVMILIGVIFFGSKVCLSLFVSLLFRRWWFSSYFVVRGRCIYDIYDICVCVCMCKYITRIS